MPRGGERKGAGRPKKHLKTAIGLRLEHSNASWLKARKGQGEMVDQMIRGQRIKELNALAEAMAHFLVTASPQEIAKAIHKVQDLPKFLEFSGLNSVDIEKDSRKSFRGGFLEGNARHRFPYIP